MPSLLPPSSLRFAPGSLARLLVLVVALWLCMLTASAQSVVRGGVADGADGGALPGASVVAFVGDEARAGASTDAEGRFSLDSLSAGSYSLRVSFVGFEPLAVDVKITDGGGAVDVGTLRLVPSGHRIDEVTVVTQAARQEQRGDTTVFNASAFKVNPDATTEDLLRKMPGIQVKDGQVSHGGETVKKVLVDGKEFFGSDPSAALRNIDASMVDKIEVFDKQSEQAEFTGFSDGNEERTINILTKSGMAKGGFGRVSAGLGSGRHFEADGVANLFFGNHRVSAVGSFNDVDRQGFSSPDAGGGAAGVNKNGSFGVNYGYENGEKLKVESSYIFAYRDNSVTSSSLYEYFQLAEGDSVRTYASQSESGSISRAHRFSMRLRWQASEKSMLIFSPSFSWQGGSSSKSSYGVDSRGSQAYSSTSQASGSDASSWSVGGGVTWRRRLSVPRRTFSVAVRASVARSSSDASSRGGQMQGAGLPPDSVAPPQPADTVRVDPPAPPESDDMGDMMVCGQLSSSVGRQSAFSVRLVYTEPLGEHWAASVNYAPSLSLSSNDKSVLADTVFWSPAAADTAFDSYSFSPSLSNVKESRYVTHRAGVAVNASFGRTFRASLGVDAQQAVLSGEQTYPLESSTRKSFFSVLPSFELKAKSANGLSVKLKYRSSSSAPSVDQLQDVVDVSDIRRFSMGNPSLRQSVSHRVGLTLTRTGQSSARSVFFSSNLSVANGFVASSSVMASADSVIATGITLPAGAQLTKPVNLDGQVSASANLTLSSPVSGIGCNAALSLGANMQRTPGIFNGQHIRSRNSSLTLGLNLGSAFSESFDFNVAYNPSYNAVRSTRAAESDYDYYSHTLRADVNLLVFNRHLVLSSSVTHNLSSGMGSGFDYDYASWNAAVAFKFLPRRQAEVRLRVNDILNTNQATGRSVREAYVQTSSSNALRRYAMLTFSYRFNDSAAGQSERKGRPGRGDSPSFPPPDGGRGGGGRAM